MSFQIESRFIGDFKTGDNIQYNLRTLRSLYEKYPTENDRVEIAKPVIVSLASIAEAMLYDLINLRIQSFTREGIQNIEAETLSRIRSLTANKFTVVIVQCKKHDLLQHVPIYEDLKELASIRNRLHIQNDKNHSPRDEAEIFTLESIMLAEKSVELIIRQLLALYPREHHCVGPFVLPWNPHIPQ